MTGTYGSKYVGAIEQVNAEIDRLVAEYSAAERSNLTAMSGFWAELVEDDFQVCMRPAPAAVLDSIRNSFGDVPESVNDFLEHMGEHPKYLDLGFGSRGEDMLRGRDAYRDWKSEMVSAGWAWYRDEDFLIPTDAIILGHHGGGTFYFVVDRTPDPEVWMMHEGDDEVSGLSKIGLTFSELVVHAIRRVPTGLQRSLESSRRHLTSE